ncbi:MAG: hypothetical protein IKX48_17965 [Victivallales bacterium]|nr:hypothetical protein [Victivallales bacterium]
MRPACGQEVPSASRRWAKEVPHASRLRAGSPIGVPPLGEAFFFSFHYIVIS